MNLCGGDVAPTVASTVPTANATGVALNSNIAITFTEPVTATASSFTVSCATSGAHSATVSAAPATIYTLNPDADFVNSELCTVTVVAAQVTDLDVPVNTMAADYIFSFTATAPVVDVAPTVVSTTPISGSVNVAINSNITIDFSEAVTATASSFTVSCATSGAHPVVLSDGPTSYTLNPAADFVNNELCTVTVVAAQVTDQDGTPNQMAANYTFTFTTIAAGTCPIAPTTTIPAVQGTGLASPVAGATVRVQGVVSAVFPGLSGFFVQDVAGDGNPLTSDGMFIFNATSVITGNLVSVSGTVAEFRDATQIGTGSTVTVCGSVTAPAPLVLDLPVPALNGQEQYEGMLVSIPETITVGQNFFLGRFGQITVSAEGRVYNPTNRNLPGSLAAIAEANLNARRMFVLDDGRSSQNPNPIPYIGLDNTNRGGDTIAGLTGILSQGPINTGVIPTGYIFQPTVAPVFTRAHPRTAAPSAVGGNAKVASFNVLNYFNGDGAGGGFPTSRGATTLLEFNRQRTKIIKALVAIDADVVGLMEIENDGDGATGALQDLVNGLNTEMGAGTYALVPSPAPGTDVIRVAMIYKPGRVTRVGAAVNYQVTTNPTYNPVFDRPPFAQTFSLNSNSEKFSVVVNHFKSKGSCPASGVDTDQGDGQGCWNAKRTVQAQNLLTFINNIKASAADDDVLVIGDLNAYGKEAPITTLTDAGMTNEIERFLGTTAYSYVFDGAAGYLDHGLATSSLNTQVTGVAEWHINADEPSVIDYNTEFKPQDLYTPTPYRASDHDPVIMGLQLGGVPTAANFSTSSKTVNTTAVTVGDQLTYTLTVVNSGQTVATYNLTDTLDASLTFVSATPTMNVNGQVLSVSGSLAGGASVVYTIVVEANAADTINNIAQLSGDGVTRQLTAPSVTVSPVPMQKIFLPMIFR